MATLDTVLRLMVIGQLVLVAVVLLVRGPGKVSIPMTLLSLGVIGFLIKSSATLSAPLSFFEIPRMVLSVGAPYFVWLCAKALFEFESPSLWVMIAFPTMSSMMCGLDVAGLPVPGFISVASLVTAIVAVLHAVYAIGQGSRDDLSQRRRQFRFNFVASVSSLTAFILLIQLFLVGQDMPAWVSLAIVSLIAVFTLVVGIPLLTHPEDLLPAEPMAIETAPILDVAEQETYNALTMAMGNRAYARTGLTIRQLAEELATPEHQLRVLINKRLGYRNFSTFLNGYRIEETCDRLKDAAEARIPILTIALDAGFASLAPFNRAFKLSTGMTPSEYRRKNMKSRGVVVPISR